LRGDGEDDGRFREISAQYHTKSGAVEKVSAVIAPTKKAAPAGESLASTTSIFFTKGPLSPYLGSMFLVTHGHISLDIRSFIATEGLVIIRII
tara:strand:- start:463 stop:741 length:279 start_codon:yes stop_codon:yes gene_type:complete